MSETAPRNSRLENFEANKAAHEVKQEELAKENYEKEFYGEAGNPDSDGADFSNEALQTLKDADFYEQSRASVPQGESADDYYDRMVREADEQEHGPHQPVEGTLEYAEHEAYAEKENREGEEAAYVEAEQRALDAKIASNPQLRLMNNLAREIAELRAETDPKDPDAAIARVQNREDALNELLAQYENNELYTISKDKDSLIPVIKVPVKYDAAVADAIMNRTRDEELERKNSEKAKAKAAETGKPAPVDTTDIDTGDLDDDGKPKPIDTSDIDTSDLDGKPTPIDTGDIDTSDLDTPAPIDTGDIDTSDLDGNPTPLDTTDIDTSDLDDADLEKPSWFKSPVGRAIIEFQDFKERRRRAAESMTDDDKEKRKKQRKITIIALGATAVAAGVVAYSLGWRPFGGNTVAGTPVPEPGAAGSGDLPFDGGIDMPDGNPPVGELDAAGREFSDAARTAHKGEGWLNELEQMGYSSQEAHAKLPKILNSTDPEIQGWVYQMSDGNPGISHTGQFSQSVLESIKNL